MLKDRIISTLQFFDLQDWPLTLLELRQFLIAEEMDLKKSVDTQGELVGLPLGPMVGADEILGCLETECQNEALNSLGFYYLPGRENIVDQRLQNYFFGIGREKLIKKYIRGLRHLPFVRGVALAGSQALGQQKQASDIDLLIITDTGFMWLARTLVTFYFQVLGRRRHGQYIANRFCLNHYLAGPKPIGLLRNLYTASEYLKLRPLVSELSIWQFKEANSEWLKAFFPNFTNPKPEAEKQSGLQRGLEKLFSGKFGRWLEQRLRQWQLPKIRQEKFIVVMEDELSFHPDSKQQQLLRRFFEF